MAMQAVIMAGGAGMRLRPMTCDCPKPLVPLCGAPVMDYALRLLARYGYDHATATAWNPGTCMYYQEMWEAALLPDEDRKADAARS